jgi:hypothetical protein
VDPVVVLTDSILFLWPVPSLSYFSSAYFSFQEQKGLQTDALVRGTELPLQAAMIFWVQQQDILAPELR